MFALMGVDCSQFGRRLPGHQTDVGGLTVAAVVGPRVRLDPGRQLERVTRIELALSAWEAVGCLLWITL